LTDRISAATSQRFGRATPTNKLNVSALSSQKVSSAIPSSRATAEEALPGAYLVHVHNGGPTELDLEVVFATSSSSEPEKIRQKLSPGQWGKFALTDPGQCQSLQAYAIFLYEDENIVDMFPPFGTVPYDVLTPRAAGQINPENTDPCADYWSFA